MKFKYKATVEGEIELSKEELNELLETELGISYNEANLGQILEVVQHNVECASPEYDVTVHSISKVSHHYED